MPVSTVHALYRLLEGDAEIRPVTAREYLEGDPVHPHPVSELSWVRELATGSWIDESGSLP